MKQMQDNPDKDVPESVLPDAVPENGMETVEQKVETDLLAAQAKVEELNEAWLRARADIENMRRRTQDDLSNAHKYSIGKFATDLLSVKDSLEMALKDGSGQFESLKDGVELTLKQLSSVFERFQVHEINPVGEKLDPHKHQAISMQASNAEINTVLEVMQKGYQLHDRVLRPAMVVVSTGKPLE
jgi:molecular chaperone GrpE